MSSAKVTLGRNVRACRKQLGLSQELLAEKVGLSETSIGMLERGLVWPQYENLQRLSDVLGVSETALFSDESIPETSSKQGVDMLAKALQNPVFREAISRDIDVFLKGKK